MVKSLGFEDRGVPPLSDLFSSKAALLGAMRSVYGECASHWRARGVDPRAYTVEAIADDVDDLRRALGVERVTLLAFSFGTRMALEVIRRHPARVDRVVLAGTLGVDQTIKLPGVFDRMLAEIGRLAVLDEPFKTELPDLVGDVARILASVERKPIALSFKDRAGRMVALSIGKEGLQAVIAGRVGDRRLPALIATLKKEDYSVLTRLVESVYNDLSSGGGP